MHFVGSSISMESDEALKYVSSFQKFGFNSHTWRPLVALSLPTDRFEIQAIQVRLVGDFRQIRHIECTPLRTLRLHAWQMVPIGAGSQWPALPLATMRRSSEDTVRSSAQ
jgi:hypothetical protein